MSARGTPRSHRTRVRVCLDAQRTGRSALAECGSPPPVAALLEADRGDLARAAELHAFTQSVSYLANSRWYYDVTGRELDEIVARLPDEVAATATERGQQLKLGNTAEALLAEFNRV